MGKLKLYGEHGWGSAIVEAQLAWYGFEYELEQVGDLFKSADGRRRLESVNPLAQVPTLVLADGTVMTESAAITLFLADIAHDDSLVPGAADPLRPAFLRWLIFLVANVYPTYTYADDPSRFVAASDAQQSFKEAVDRYACRLYALLERQAEEPWFLGERFSALDVYVTVMTRWRPRRAWFAEHAPRLFAIATKTEAHHRLAPVWRENFAND
ncbi:MAG TPA: glutathione S-transferase [Gammaproteobacteria bacterium]|nr:glutathione S-transferase [Gammaproteobacteria bacterium]